MCEKVKIRPARPDLLLERDGVLHYAPDLKVGRVADLADGRVLVPFVGALQQAHLETQEADIACS